MTRFGVDLPHFAAQCISFLIVAVLLQRYAYKPILVMLDERKKQIKESLENAEKIKQELANTQAKTHEIMVQALVFMLLTAVFTMLICVHDEGSGGAAH